MANTQTINGIDCEPGADSSYQLRKLVFADDDLSKMLELANRIAITQPFLKAIVTEDGQFWLAGEFRANLEDEFGIATAAQIAQAISEVTEQIKSHIHTLN